MTRAQGESADAFGRVTRMEAAVSMLTPTLSNPSPSPSPSPSPNQAAVSMLTERSRR